jgi:hypothetical protein
MGSLLLLGIRDYYFIIFPPYSISQLLVYVTLSWNIGHYFDSGHCFFVFK